MFEPVFMVCDSANVDATTGQCSAPYWVPQPQIFPSLSAADGASIAAAILLAWAVAYGSQALKVRVE